MIPHSRPTLGAAEARAARRVLASGQLAMGDEVSAFEREAARWIGRRHAVATASGTSALHLSLLALGAGPGKEVVCPSWACSAILNAVLACGAKPVVADVDREGGFLTPEGARRAITRRTAALIAVHPFGRPAPVRETARLGVPVVEDCAIALGAGVGRGGAVTVLSFYATKLLTSGGQGGMALSDDARLAEGVRDLLLHDNRDDYRLRFNAQMTDLQAAVGRVQLGRLDGFLMARERLARRYARALGLPFEEKRSWFRYLVEVDDARRTAKALARKGIEAKPPVFRPLHRCLHLDPARFPNAEAIQLRTLSIPLYPSLSRDYQDRAINALRINLYRELKQSLLEGDAEIDRTGGIPFPVVKERLKRRRQPPGRPRWERDYGTLTP